MTHGDRLLVLCVVLTALIAVPVSAIALSSRAPGMTIVCPSGTSVVDLGEDGAQQVQGRQGRLTFEVRDGRVRCVDAECPDHTCMRMGVASAGRPIVCAPNGVIVYVGSDGGSPLDAVSR